MPLERRYLQRYPINKNLPSFALHLPPFPIRKNLEYTMDDAALMKNILVHLAVRGNNDEFTTRDQPPSYLFHQMQVITVTEELIRDDLHPERMALATIVAGAHDLGRSVNNNETHIPIGYDIAKTLGIPDDIARIILLHHQWGLGIDPFGALNFNAYADFEENMGKPMQEDPSIIMNEWKKALGEPNELLFLSAIATNIADNSKRKTIIKTEKDNIPIPYIDEFTPLLGHQLIQIQLDKGSFARTNKDGSVNEKGEARYWREYSGIYFVLNQIAYFEKRTGVSYKDAIYRARNRYKNEVEPWLRQAWQERYSDIPRPHEAV